MRYGANVVDAYRQGDTYTGRKLSCNRASRISYQYGDGAHAWSDRAAIAARRYCWRSLRPAQVSLRRALKLMELGVQNRWKLRAMNFFLPYAPGGRTRLGVRGPQSASPPWFPFKGAPTPCFVVEVNFFRYGNQTPITMPLWSAQRVDPRKAQPTALLGIEFKGAPAGTPPPQISRRELPARCK